MNIHDRIVEEAATWLRTPWRHMARVKHAGVDCAQFLIAVYSAVGLIPEIDAGYYPADWHLHKEQPRFLELLLQYADAVDDYAVGDIAMFQYGRHAAHGSIVLDYPRIIHAWRDEGAVTITDLDHSPLAGRFSGFYRLKGLD